MLLDNSILAFKNRPLNRTIYYPKFAPKYTLMKLKFLLVLSLICIYGCKNEIDRGSSILNYIPENAGVIVKINDISRLKSELKNNTFILSVNASQAYKNIAANVGLLKYINSDASALLAFIPSVEDTTHVFLILSDTNAIQLNDSVANTTKESLNFNGIAMERYMLEDQLYFNTRHEDHLLISTSKTILEDAINNKDGQNPHPTLNALFAISDPQKSATLYYHTKDIENKETEVLKNTTRIHLPDYSDWLALDLDSHPDELKLNGIALARDSSKHFVKLFDKSSSHY